MLNKQFKNDSVLNIASLKAYGDFLVAMRALNSIRSNSNIRIVANYHLKPLYNALNQEDLKIDFLSLSNKYGIPAIFDLKKQGVFYGTKSILELRRYFLQNYRDQNFLVDRIGIRERIIFSGVQKHQLPLSNNIYNGYMDFFLENNIDFSDYEYLTKIDSINKVLIIPGSRIKEKCFPYSVMVNLKKIIEKEKIEAVFLKLNNEEIELPLKVKIKSIEPSFIKLREEIKSSDVVIAADSLPAHLADYLGKPTFVLGRQHNKFWLPINSYRFDYVATFDDLEKVENWFLDGLYR